MKNLLSLALVVNASLFAPPSAPSSQTKIDSDAAPLAQPRFVAIAGELDFTGELIVRPRQNLTRAERKRALALISAETIRHHAATDEFILASSNRIESLGAYENRCSDALLATDLFQYAHPNWMVYPLTVPNDPRLGEQWHHAMIESYDAWSISSGSPSVVVAVTDTGITAHEDLVNRVSGYNAVSRIPEDLGGNLADIHGHGTHVAGCAAATGDNGVGVAGVGWNLSIMPIRVSELSSGGASYDALLRGARWAIENGARVVSASYSGVGFASIEVTGEYIHTLDGSFMWAAGNSATNHFAWDYDHVLVIGASDSNDERAWFSSYGRGVDLFAPGVSILSTTMDGSYQAWSGTSMATPLANGVLGVIRSVNPALSAQHAEYILQHNCDTWGDMVNSAEWGFGRLNFKRAVEQAGAAATPQAPIARNDVARSIVSVDVVVDALLNDYDANMDTLDIDWVASVSSLGDTVEIEPLQSAGSPTQIRMLGNVTASAGVRTIPYRLIEPISGQTSEAVISITLDPLRVPTNPVGEVSGLHCDYYELGPISALPDWSTLTPYASELASEINIASTMNNFSNSGRVDQVGAVYTGWISIPSPGLWTLLITSDDGSRLSIGEEVVINNDGQHVMLTGSADLAFAAGMYPVRYEFFENIETAGFIAEWSGPGVERQPIPAENFFSGGTVSPADVNQDGSVDGADLAIVLAAWDTSDVVADINGDGNVDGADLTAVLNGWGE